MPTRDSGSVIAYGAIGDPKIAVSHELTAMRDSGRRLSPRLAISVPGERAIRLNSSGWAKLDPQCVAELATHEGRVGFCERTLLARTPLFARPLQDFIANYVAFIGATIEQQRQVLERKLTRFGLPKQGGLLGVSDWFFSAYLPLPNAYFLVDDAEGKEPRFARADCAFWSGNELIVILFEGLTMAPRSQLRALDALTETRGDYRFFRVRPTVRGDLSIFSSALGELLAEFPVHSVKPYGLFRIPAISASV